MKLRLSIDLLPAGVTVNKIVGMFDPLKTKNQILKPYKFA